MFQSLTESSETPVVVALPGTTSKVPGILGFDPETGIDLAITDVTSDPAQVLSTVQATYPAICGQMQDGRLFTLLGCLVEKTSGGIFGVTSRVIGANAMLSGIHIADPSERTFDEIEARLSSLNEWFAIMAVQQSLEQLQPPEVGRRATIACQHAPGFGFSPVAGGSSLLSEQNISVGSHERLSHGEIRSTFSLRIRPRNPFALDALVEELFRIQGFLSLLCGHQVFIEAVKLLRAGTSGMDRAMTSSQYLSRFARPPARKVGRTPEVLLPRPVLGNSLPLMWTRWNERYDLYRTPIELFMATEMFHGQLLNFEFLAVMQAIETLHRNVAGGTYLEAEEYEKVADALKAAVPDGVPSDLRSALTSRLRYGNEYSLRRRIRELWEMLPEGVKSLLHPDFPAFQAKLIDTRNYLTHYDPQLAPQAFQGSDLYFAARLVRWVCLSFLLVDLGVEERALTDALERSQELAHVRKVLTRPPGMRGTSSMFGTK